ncbi:hypothetical protein HNR06_002377 [Nocardiopsis arvandica]|uniref:Uncharacterized protein n=1 Tax=Nocardiopsis sinuspersici TaxID=501010 RepID=A0A7Z0BIJ8_9ACTN|nr:hypothetical protein [Nocardiopsis sinuspersici]NYH52788.1 hypothetical protein [Nocardiopsis sinuspersici]
MPERIDAILTEYPGYGWGVESPQLPELVGGRDTWEELESDLHSILEFGGAPPDFVSAIHLQKWLLQNEGPEIAIRCRRDSHFHSRMEVVKRLAAAVADENQLRQISVDLPRRPTGEILFVCSVVEDRLDTVFQQLDPRGDALTIAVSVADRMVFTTPVSNSGEGDRPGWSRVSEIGWDENTTVGELVKFQQKSNKKVSLLV